MPIQPMPGLVPHPTTGVVPTPQRWHSRPGTFTLGQGIVISYNDDALAGTANILAQELTEISGLSVNVASASAAEAVDAGIHLTLNPSLPFPDDAGHLAHSEGYVLSVGSSVEIAARTEQAVFWGTRSLLQMSLANAAKLPQGTVVDWPNYAVRGFMLDVGRRFAAPGFIRDYIKFLSWNKLNTFLIHLNDNEITKDTKRQWSQAQHGFRLASENPRFAGLASTDGSYDRATWDGFEDLAHNYHVNIVPELDVPAHSRAIIAWKPELGLNAGDSDMLDLNNPQTVETVKDLFTEFDQWFRGPAVHFGADEYERGHSETYKSFFNQIAAHIRGLGKDPIAWGSLTVMSEGAGDLEDGYSRDVVMCSWNNGWYGPEAAIADGYKIINTNDGLLYIVPFADYYHGKGLDTEQLFENWEPNVFADGQVIEPGHPQLLGAASALWNDLVLLDYTESDVHELIQPSFATLAQKMWTGKVAGFDFASFDTQAKARDNWPGAEYLK